MRKLRTKRPSPALLLAVLALVAALGGTAVAADPTANSAANAKKIAKKAKKKAKTAIKNAQAAQDTADAAQSAANNAQSTANNAQAAAAAARNEGVAFTNPNSNVDLNGTSFTQVVSFAAPNQANYVLDGFVRVDNNTAIAQLTTCEVRVNGEVAGTSALAIDGANAGTGQAGSDTIPLATGIQASELGGANTVALFCRANAGDPDLDTQRVQINLVETQGLTRIPAA